MTVQEGIGCFGAVKESSQVRVENKSANMVESLAGRPQAVGMVDAIAIVKSKGKIKPLGLNGRHPSPGSVKNGTWPMVKELNLVLGKKKSPGIRRFMQFVLSEEGQAIIRKDDATPSRFRIDF